MFEIGNSLREARLRQTLDFPEVEQATKIRGKYLRALEDEQFDILPGQTYVKGFLRTYSEYLGLDSTRGFRPTAFVELARSGVSSSPGMYRELYSST